MQSPGAGKGGTGNRRVRGRGPRYLAEGHWPQDPGVGHQVQRQAVCHDDHKAEDRGVEVSGGDELLGRAECGNGTKI